MKFWSTFSLWSLVEKLSARLQYRHNLHGNSSATVELLQSCTKIQTTVSIFFNISLNIRKSKVNWKMIFCERKCMKTLLRILEKVIITKNGVTAILHYTDYRQDWARFVPLLVSCSYYFFSKQQGKSEGFESCDRPIIRKRPIWVKIGDVLSRVTLKFDGWPWKTIGHLSFAVSSFVQHFIAIGEFKLELLSGNAQFGSNSMIFRAVWPWNLTYDLEKQ